MGKIGLDYGEPDEARPMPGGPRYDDDFYPLPAACPYTVDEILAEDWYPEPDQCRTAPVSGHPAV